MEITASERQRLHRSAQRLPDKLGWIKGSSEILLPLPYINVRVCVTHSCRKSQGMTDGELSWLSVIL